MSVAFLVIKAGLYARRGTKRKNGKRYGFTWGLRDKMLGENRFFALQHRAVHVAQLALIEVKSGVMKGCSVIPDQNIAEFPFVAVVKFRLIAMGIKLVHESEAFFVFHAIYVLNAHLIHIK